MKVPTYRRLANINTNIEYANIPATTLINLPFHLLITTIISTINFAIDAEVKFP